LLSPLLRCAGSALRALGAVSAAATMTSRTATIGGKVFFSTESMLSRGAENVNAAINLNKKLSRLSKSQETAAKIRNLSDGRIRYYSPEAPSARPGPTRGSSYVTEFNPLNGKVRTWMECYDHYGKVNRVHPKQINGQECSSQHYPPTRKEL
jgi:hypothetical protein